MDENPYGRAHVIFIIVGALNSVAFLMGLPLEAWDAATLSEFCWPLCAAAGSFIAAWGSKTGNTWRLVSGIAVLGIAIAIRRFGGR